MIGGVIGLALPLWISFGAYDIGVSDPYLNTSIANCTSNKMLNGTKWDLNSDEIFRYEDV